MLGVIIMWPSDDVSVRSILLLPLLFPKKFFIKEISETGRHKLSFGRILDSVAPT